MKKRPVIASAILFLMLALFFTQYQYRQFESISTFGLKVLSPDSLSILLKEKIQFERTNPLALFLAREKMFNQCISSYEPAANIIRIHQLIKSGVRDPNQGVTMMYGQVCQSIMSFSDHGLTPEGIVSFFTRQNNLWDDCGGAGLGKMIWYLINSLLLIILLSSIPLIFLGKMIVLILFLLSLAIIVLISSRVEVKIKKSLAQEKIVEIHDHGSQFIKVSLAQETIDSDNMISTDLALVDIYLTVYLPVVVLIFFFLQQKVRKYSAKIEHFPSIKLISWFSYFLNLSINLNIRNNVKIY